MKIAFVLRTHIYYSSELANALIRSGHEVVMVLPNDSGDVVVPEGEDVQQCLRALLDSRAAVEFVTYSYTNLASMSKGVACARQIAGILKKHKPDVIHLQDVGDYRHVLALWMLRPSVPVVNTTHDASPHPGYNYSSFSLHLRRFVRRLASCIVVHGEKIKEQLAQQGIELEKINVIPHGSYASFTRWKSNLNEEPFTILAFGKIYEYKGLEYLVQAEPLIRSQVPDIKIVVAGSGSHWDNVEPLIEHNDSFELHIRTIPDEEVAQLFQRAAVIVLPYIEASQSGVLNVANAFAKPVIATNVGSLPEAVHDEETGIIVPPKDAQALADAVIKLLQNPDLRRTMGAKAHEVATSGEFSWDNIAVKTVEVYKKALAR